MLWGLRLNTVQLAHPACELWLGDPHRAQRGCPVAEELAHALLGPPAACPAVQLRRLAACARQDIPPARLDRLPAAPECLSARNLLRAGEGDRRQRKHLSILLQHME